jgi:hypothetical protein
VVAEKAHQGRCALASQGERVQDEHNRHSERIGQLDRCLALLARRFCLCMYVYMCIYQYTYLYITYSPLLYYTYMKTHTHPRVVCILCSQGRGVRAHDDGTVGALSLPEDVPHSAVVMQRIAVHLSPYDRFDAYTCEHFVYVSLFAHSCMYIHACIYMHVRLCTPSYLHDVLDIQPAGAASVGSGERVDLQQLVRRQRMRLSGAACI